MSKSCVCRRLSIISLGFGVGVAWAVCVLVLGFGAVFFDDWGADMVELMSSVYVGFSDTVGGALIGGLWGFVDGFIFGVILAFFYNLCARCCCGKASVCPIHTGSESSEK